MWAGSIRTRLEPIVEPAHTSIPASVGVRRSHTAHTAATATQHAQVLTVAVELLPLLIGLAGRSRVPVVGAAVETELGLARRAHHLRRMRKQVTNGSRITAALSQTTMAKHMRHWQRTRANTLRRRDSAPSPLESPILRPWACCTWASGTSARKGPQSGAPACTTHDSKQAQAGNSEWVR